MIAGQDGVMDAIRNPRVHIAREADPQSQAVDRDLEAETNQIRRSLQLANGMQYTLTGGTCKAGFENNTRDGQVRVRWEGLACQEITL